GVLPKRFTPVWKGHCGEDVALKFPINVLDVDKEAGDVLAGKHEGDGPGADERRFGGAGKTGGAAEQRGGQRAGQHGREKATHGESPIRDSAGTKLRRNGGSGQVWSS